MRPFVLLALALAMSAAEPFHATLSVSATILNPVDRHLFGQFLERSSFGEPGPEAAADPATGNLDPAVIASLKALAIPEVRFPGGTDVDFTDWTDLIDNVPGRGKRPAEIHGTGAKPLGTRFGYDEYFRMRDQIGCQTVLVVNLLDGLAKRKPLVEAARHAAGLVAYANAAQGAKLPEGMPDWPAVRAANGHPEPWPLEYVQLGNEYFLGPFRDAVRSGSGLKEGPELSAWFATVLRAYITAIREVAPQVRFIADAECNSGDDVLIWAQPDLRHDISLVAIHTYAPGPSRDERRARGHGAGKPTPAERWLAWTAMPGSFGADGQNNALGDRAVKAAAIAPVAVTEWNFNAYSAASAELPGDWRVASGLAVAGFLNGMTRQGATIHLATQSMLMGVTWGIGGINIDPATRRPIETRPSALVTAAYSRLAGDRRLALAMDGVPLVEQPFAIGWAPALEHVALLDAVATADDGRVVLHLVNRDPARAAELEIGLVAVAAKAVTAEVHRFAAPAVPGAEAMVETVERIAITGGKLGLTVPERSLAIVVVGR